MPIPIRFPDGFCVAILTNGQVCGHDAIPNPDWLRYPSLRLELCKRHWDHVDDELQETAHHLAEREVARLTDLRDELVAQRRLLAYEQAEFDARRRRSASRRSVVYYLRRGDRLVKIGVTTNLVTRMTTLAREYGSLVLLGTEKGGAQLEHARHTQFASDRVVGEWFQPSAALLGHIDSLEASRAQAS